MPNNAFQPNQFHAMQTHMHLVPAPVPAPQQFHRQIPPNPIVYDQNYYVGACAPAQPLHMAPSMAQQQRFEPVRHTAQHVPVMSQPARISTPTVAEQAKAHAPEHAQQQPKLDKESIAKLFNDKQIMLTDFLNIASKVTGGSDRPIDMSNKIRVLSRCQDAVKVMSKDSSVTGRFFMRKSLAQSRTSQTPTLNPLMSPLKRNPAVRFRFTAKTPLNEDMVYRTSVQHVLHKLGLPDGTEPAREYTPEPEELQPAQETFAPQQQVAPEPNNVKTVVMAAPKKDVLQKMCQTDPVSLCRECKIRSERQFVSVGCQYDERMFVNVGTQVSGMEDSFTPARAHLQGLLKHRSLASMTPAQILAQVATKPSPVKDELAEMRLPTNWDDRSMRRADLNRDLFNYNEQERHPQYQLQRDGNSYGQSGNPGTSGNMYPMNQAGHFNQGFNQFGQNSNNQNFGGNRFYNN